jgi:large subunit ribosomal protein L4
MPQMIDGKGKALKDVAVPAAFASNVSGKTNAIFRAVFRELASPRAGTHSTLKRDEVRGGGRKPWKQKGTGRARQGSIRSPQWRHGGVVFGPQPRSYVSALNKKERKAALLAALSDKFQNGSVTILATDGLVLNKTKEFATLLFGSPKAAKSGVRTLVVFAESELATVGESLSRTGNNVVNAAVTHTGALDIKDIVGYTRLVLTAAANDALIARFAAPEKKSA